MATASAIPADHSLGREPAACSGRVRLAILGGGAVVSEFHVPSAQLSRHVEIVAIADPSPNATERLRDAGYSGPVLAATFQDVWKLLVALPGGAPEAVVIALPNHLHEAATLAALENGFHVLCEKPLALTEAACHRMGDAARQGGRVLAVGMVRRLLPSVTALREALAAGLAGEIRSVEIEDGAYYAWLSDSGAFFRRENGGILADMGVHYLDLAADLFGTLEPLDYHDDWRGGCEANAEFRLRTPTGVPLRLRLSRDRTLGNRLVVAGNRGRLFLKKDDFTVCYWELRDAPGVLGKLEPVTAFEDRCWPRDFVSAFAQQFEEFAAAVRGTRQVRCSAREGAATIGLIERAYAGREHESARCGPTFGHVAPDRAGPSLAPGPVVVTGGTGFIGSRLVARLATQCCGPIVAPVRGYRNCVELARFAVEMPKLDLLDEAAVQTTVRGARHVFHLAYGRDGDNADRVTIDGTRNVVEAAIAAGCDCVVVLSTLFVFGRPRTAELVDESWPYAPIGPGYGASKAAMERWCLARAASSPHTRIVILNPGYVFGVQGKTFTRMPAEMASRGQFCWIEGGRGIAAYVYVENLIDAMILAAECKEAHGRRFLICDGERTWREFLTPLLGPYADELASYTLAELEALNQSAPKRLLDLLRAVARSPEIADTINGMRWLGPLKQFALRRLPRWRKDLQRLSRRKVTTTPPRGIPPAWLAELFAPATTRFSARLAAEVLGWKPRVEFADAIAATTEWLREIGVLC